jgi:O-antigen/teichoic acid export membrane protein/glycosyltransferase involved in cell wall biosynthesis
MINDRNSAPPSADGQMLRGSIWMIALRWSIRLTGLASTIILARLLVPADFGIVAMAMVVVGMLELLNQTGQKLAIIRQHEPTREHFDTAWTLSVIIGLLIGAAIVVLAPFTSYYFHEPRAVPVMQWLSLRAVIGGFENIGTVNFRRDPRFDRFFVYNMYPKLISFAVTIVLAIVWRNYWALVAGIITSQLALNIASYVMHPYRPRFSLARIGEIGSFSGWTLFRTIGIYLNTQIDQVAVGGAFGSTVMGRYSVAADLASSPLDEINGPMVAVLYPVMSRVQHDPQRLRALYLRTLCWSAIICASASVGVTLVAHDMVGFVLGQKWLIAEPLVGWLALSAGLLGLSSGAYTTFDALGKPHLGARMQWVRLTFLAVAIVPVALVAPFPRYIAETKMVVTALFMPTLFFAVGREVGASWRDYLQALWRPFVAAAVMAAVIAPVNHIVPPGHLRLAFDVFLGAGTFATALLSLWWLSGCPDSPEKDIFALVHRHLQRRRGGQAGPIHIISKFGTIAGGTEQRALRLAQILGKHAEVKLWATHAPDPAIEDRADVTTIDFWRLQFPISGTFIFVGVYLHIGGWIRFAKPDRRIIVLNTNSVEEFRRMVRRISPVSDIEGCEIVYSSDALRQLVGTPGSVENSPIDIERFSTNRTDRSPGPLTIGRLSRDYIYKFHERDPQLFRKLGESGYRLRVLGGTCLKGELEGARNVELIRAGAIAAPEFLQSLDCFIYRTRTTWFESYGRVVMEAMASGLPVLCGPIGGFTEHIEHGVNGFIFYEDNEAIEILRRLSADPALRETIGQRARETAERIYSREYEMSLVEFYLRKGLNA